jgi:hypothetical protein
VNYVAIGGMQDGEIEYDAGIERGSKRHMSDHSTSPPIQENLLWYAHGRVDCPAVGHHAMLSVLKREHLVEVVWLCC